VAAPADYDPPTRLRQLPSWLVGQTDKRAQALIARALEDAGLRRQHFAVLTSLAEQGEASQAALGRRLSIDRSDLHAILEELERDRLVARVRDANDRRRNVVTLTPAGRLGLKRLDARVDTAQRELLAPLSSREQADFVRMLERVSAPRPDDS
jgi:DNA-binding MarR family transcriptional regulator